MSDLARYSILYHQRGFYCDVDIDPNNVILKNRLRHKDIESEIPLLGPCFRTEQDAKNAGYFDNAFGTKDASSLRRYNRK